MDRIRQGNLNGRIELEFYTVELPDRWIYRTAPQGLVFNLIENAISTA